MRMIFISVLLSMLIFNIFGQVTDTLSFGQVPDTLSYNQQSLPGDSIQLNKISYSLTTGASVSAGNHLSAASTFFIAPEVSYQFSPKLYISAGLQINQNNYSGSNSNQNVFFASGDYAISPRLFLNGSMMTSISSGTSSNSKEGSWQSSFQAFSMGMSYKVNHYLSISAGMSFLHTNESYSIPNTRNSGSIFGLGNNSTGY